MEGFHQLVNPFYLALEFLRRGRPMCLVVLKHLMSEGWGGTVKGDSPMRGLEISKHFEQGAGKAIHGVYHLSSLGLSQWRKGMKRSVHQGIAVKKQQKRFLSLCHSLIILWRCSKLPAGLRKELVQLFSGNKSRLLCRNWKC